MSRLEEWRRLYRNCQETAYEILEVAAPGDRRSQLANLFILGLVLLNVLAFGLAWPYGEAYAVYFDYFELFSVAVFSLEYLLRLWSSTCAAVGTGAVGGRLRFALRPLSLADLAAVLPFYLPLLVPLDLRVVRLLRLARLLRLIKLARYLQAPPVDEVELNLLLDRFSRDLKGVRDEAGRDGIADLARVNRLLEEAVGQIRQVQQNWLVQRRRGLAGEAWADIRQRLTRPLETLEADLVSQEMVEAGANAMRRAFEQSAALAEQVPEWSVVEVDLRWKGVKSYLRVPVNRTVRYHFSSMPQRFAAASESYRRIYTEETRRAMGRALQAVHYILEQEEKAQLAPSQAAQVGFDRAVNRLRDLAAPVQAAWDDILWRLEEEQQDRVDKARTDLGRYGSPLFYLGRWSRWAGQGGAGLWAQARGRAWGLVALARVESRRVYGQLEVAARPALLWIGLIKPPPAQIMRTFDEIRLDSVLRRGLPQDYLGHFAFVPLADEMLFVGFERELATIDQAIQRWERGVTSSFVVHGQRGGGKTSLLNLAVRRLFDADQPVLRSTVETKVRTAEELTSYLCGLLDLPPGTGFEAVAQSLLAGPRRAIILEGCHNLFARHVGGLEAMRHLCWLVARTNHHVLWGLCMGQYAYAYLNHVLPMGRLFHFEVAIQPWEAAQLRQLVMLRHHQSGYDLRYALDESVEGALRRRVKRWRRPDEPAVQEALAQIYFERLALACGVNILTAFYYWLRSLEPVDAERFEVRPMEQTDLDLLRSFSLEQNCILVALLQHDNLTATELAEILDTDPIQTRLELEIMANQNLLEFDLETRRFRLNAVVFSPVAGMLLSRNILH